jgi:GH25 family lysozyme M1 (1,4-beta-N-acetylmuramidase)
MKGIDVAKWNKITDYAAVKKAGVEFAITKVINKSNNPDSSLYNHIEGFKKASISCSMGYTYSYADTLSKATTAATKYCKYAGEVGIDYLWLDLEDTCMQGLGSRIIDIINEYKTIAQGNGLKIGIYTYYAYYNSYIKPYISRLGGIPFWIARYPSVKEMKITDAVPNTNNLPVGISISGWQYSSKGLIDGINGHVDLDAWYEDKTISVSKTIITADRNPFTEPVADCKMGTLGNDANWVLWYLWRFGKLLDAKGQPDQTQINSLYTNETAQKVREVQKLLGLTVDGVVGRQTRAAFKKLA